MVRKNVLQASWWKSPFVLFTLLMAIKFYMAWYVIFDDSPIWLPVATNLPSVLAAFALVELLARKRKLLWYVIVNAILTSVYFAVIMYYKYFGIIVTYHALSQVGQVTEVKGSVFQLMHPYFLLIYVDLVVIVAMLLFKRSRSLLRQPSRTLPGWAAAGVFAVSVAICFINIWPNREIVNELKQTEQMGIVNYEMYRIFSNSDGKYVSASSITPSAIRSLKELPATAGSSQAEHFGAAEGRNIIYIQLEAFQNFLIGLDVDGQEITPVLNQLVKEAAYFPNLYQQVGQGNTSDAEFMANTSFYVPPTGAASQTYASKALPSLPKRLAELGYNTVTFHTNDVSFWNRQELYTALGFNDYYDREQFKDEDLVHFGSSDEVLYRFAADELKQLASGGQPIYANIISMSAHHPFNLPQSKVAITLPDRFDGTFIGDYLYSQNYADLALGQFVEQLKADGLWENSVLAIYGDHMGVPIYSLTEIDRDLLDGLLGHPYSYAEMLNIPLLIVAPGALEAQELPVLGGQIDIMPTVANLAGISLDNQVVFGQDLLNTASNLLPERYYLPSGSFIHDGGVFIPGEGFEDGDAYPLAGASGGRAATKAQFDRALKLLNFSHNYVQQLPEWKKQSY